MAQERYTEAMQAAYDANVRPLLNPAAAASLWSDWQSYAIDGAQRTVLFWDTIRQRGNTFIERAQKGLPPVLHFAYETVVDGRTLARPVNYALVRIVPPEGGRRSRRPGTSRSCRPGCGHGGACWCSPAGSFASGGWATGASSSGSRCRAPSSPAPSVG
jgi:hypothetical protein